ncbi:MAG: hypothetical protein M3323_04470 [Actinomycetota bacterium]|nr:hypothetical protein [Actinomycetota bacterium]
MPSIDPIRLRDLLQGFEGSWVAIKDGQVEAASSTPDGLQVQLVGKRIRGATILRVPDFDEPELVGFG